MSYPESFGEEKREKGKKGYTQKITTQWFTQKINIKLNKTQKSLSGKNRFFRSFDDTLVDSIWTVKIPDGSRKSVKIYFCLVFCVARQASRAEAPVISCFLKSQKLHIGKVKEVENISKKEKDLNLWKCGISTPCCACREMLISCWFNKWNNIYSQK